MTTYLEQLHNRLNASCPEIAKKPLHRSGVRTTEKHFLVAQVSPMQFHNVQCFMKDKESGVRLSLLEEHLLSFIEELYNHKLDRLNKLDVIPQGYANFFTFFWCWGAWHKNKKYDWPIIVDPSRSDKGSYASYGGNHRLMVAQIYNMIFSSNYTVETICEKHADYFKGQPYNKQVTKFLYGSGGKVTIDRPHPVVHGHKCSISYSKHHEPQVLTKIVNSFDWPDLLFNEVAAKQLNSIFNTDVFQTGSNCINLTLKLPWFKFLQDYTMASNRAAPASMLCGLFCCIFLKIPVESEYFSLKFQK